MKPASITDVHCWRCDAPVFYVLQPVTPRMELLLDAVPVADGPLWVDDNGFVRRVAEMYLDGEKRYTAHLLTCPKLHPGEWQDDRDQDHEDTRAALGWKDDR